MTMRYFFRWISVLCLVFISGVSLRFLLTTNNTNSNNAMRLLDTTPAHASTDWIHSSSRSHNLYQSDRVMDDMEATELEVLQQAGNEICPDQIDDDDDSNPYALGNDYFILDCKITVDHINSVHIQRFDTLSQARAGFGQQDAVPSFPPGKRIYPAYETADGEEQQTRHYWLARRWIISSRALDRTDPKRTIDPLEVSLIVYDAAEDYGLFSTYTSYLPLIQS